jgi:hypothetical protein
MRIVEVKGVYTTNSTAFQNQVFLEGHKRTTPALKNQSVV